MRITHRNILFTTLVLWSASVWANSASDALAQKSAESKSVYPLAGALRVNPFARPLKTAVAPVRQSARSAAPTANPVLKGVLAAGNDSFANVEGTVVGLGESFGDLKLIGVKDDSATFLRGGSRITLTVSSVPDAGAASAEEASQ